MRGPPTPASPKQATPWCGLPSWRGPELPKTNDIAYPLPWVPLFASSMLFSWCSVWDVCVKSLFSRCSLCVSVAALNWRCFSCLTPSLSLFRSSPHHSPLQDDQHQFLNGCPPLSQTSQSHIETTAQTPGPQNSSTHRWPKPHIRCSFV